MAAARKKSPGPTPVEAITHEGDKRANIPTRELEGFASGTDPETLLYDRDPSLDPQLVWNGKDAQDRAPLEVKAPPIYIQEKIDPRVIIENLRRTAARPEDEPELRLFDAFDEDLSFDEKVEFYTHPDRWKNRLILGDSLAVMASLAEKEDLKGKVQTIYMDPPYGIKFGSNWQVSTRKRDVKDGSAADVTREPEQVKAYRDTWELGIHSYLTYLRDRFTVARDLLRESGSIFVQIGDENVHLVRSVLDEVFGSESFVSLITYNKTTGAGSGAGGTLVIPAVSDYLVWYARNPKEVKYRQVYKEKVAGEEGATKYDQVQLADGDHRPLTAEERAGAPIPDGAEVFTLDNMTSQTGVDKTRFPVVIDGREFTPHPAVWKTGEAGMARLLAADRIVPLRSTIRYRRFLRDFPLYPLNNTWMDVGGVQSRSDPKIYAVQTSTTAIQRCLLMTTDPGDLVLDPTCGSGTTAVVAEQWGRRWITCDTSRVALALARTRIMSARFPYYVLSDSEEGAKRDAKETGTAPTPGPHDGDIRRGFVYKRVPHITLKSIAQNPDIEEGMSREEIDDAIRRHADLEVLYDQPHEDKKRVRVAGPFTVESLSPHRTMTADEPDKAPAGDGEVAGSHNLEASILENLKAAGVQNTVKHERLTFETLHPHAGQWVQATGTHRVGAGDLERVAVAIGPEHGTVGPELVREAAKEAMRGAGVDLLLVCGFAFDPHSSETAAEINEGGDAWATAAGERTLGSLPVLLVKMNPDLAMGDDLLKKTGSGNLFMVFGEPDIAIRAGEGADGDQLVVELHGLDVYDPTTGDVRSHATDDIASWFVDTDYDSESFFVRHAYFTGADEPYETLAKALRADIDPDAWATLYRTESRPFEPPSTGKIAVKVINHYGDEVLKVYEVSTAPG